VGGREVQGGGDTPCLRSYRRTATGRGRLLFTKQVQTQEVRNCYPEKLMAAAENCKKQKFQYHHTAREPTQHLRLHHAIVREM